RAVLQAAADARREVVAIGLQRDPERATDRAGDAAVAHDRAVRDQQRLAGGRRDADAALFVVGDRGVRERERAAVDAQRVAGVARERAVVQHRDAARTGRDRFTRRVEV